MNYEELRKFVYSTPPMIEAQKYNKKFERLNMNSKENKNKGIIPDTETARMILNAEKIDKNSYIPSDEVLEKFESELIKAGL